MALLSCLQLALTDLLVSLLEVYARYEPNENFRYPWKPPYAKGTLLGWSGDRVENLRVLRTRVRKSAEYTNSV